MSIRNQIIEAVGRGAVAVFQKVGGRRMEVGRGLSGYRVASPPTAPTCTAIPA